MKLKMKGYKGIFLLSLIFLTFLPQLALANPVIFPPTTNIWPPFHILLLFLTFDFAFNFFVAAWFFSLMGKNILTNKLNYFIAILIITLSGVAINFVIGPAIGYETGIFEIDYTINLIRRAILSLGQIILFPFVFSWFKLSDKKLAFKVGSATVILGYLVGCVIAFFYIGAPVTPIAIA